MALSDDDVDIIFDQEYGIRLQKEFETRYQAKVCEG